MPVQFPQRGGAVYLIFDDATAVDAAAVTLNGETFYRVTDAALAGAGLTAGKRLWQAFFGTAAAASSGDTPLRFSGEIHWDAAAGAEVTTATQASLAAGFAGAPVLLEEQLIGSGGDPSNPLTWQPDSPMGAMHLALLAQFGLLPDEDAVAALAAGSGTTDVEDANLADARVAVLRRMGTKLRSVEPLYLSVGENGGHAPLCAASFASDLSPGGRVQSVASIDVTQPEGATAGSLTVVGDPKRDKDHARFQLAVSDDATPGDYTLTIKVTYSDGSGGAVGLVDVQVS